MRVQKKSHCPSCNEQSVFSGGGVNHWLHGILSVMTFGFWAVIWLYITFFSKRAKNYTCDTCGTTIMLTG